MVVLVVVALLGSLGRARGEKALSAMKWSLSPPSATPICQYYLFTTSIFSYGGARSPGSRYFFFLYHDTNEHCGTGRCTNGVTTRAPELDSDSEILPVTILMDIKVPRQRGI